MTFEEGGGSLLDHLEELRRTLLKCLLVIGIGCAFAFACYQPIIEWFTAPLLQKSLETRTLFPEPVVTLRVENRHAVELQYVLPTNSQFSEKSHDVVELGRGAYTIPPGGVLVYASLEPPKRALVVLGPLDGISLVLKTAFWVGLVATAPVWGYFLARFVAPGLREGELRAMGMFLVVSGIFIVLGATFAYQVTIPIANAYLKQFNDGIGENWWTLVSYLDYTLFLLVANGVAFQVGVVGLFAVHYRILTRRILENFRRHAIVSSFIIGALLTPPDVVTQLMLAVPLILFYELVILYAKIRESFLRSGLPNVD